MISPMHARLHIFIDAGNVEYLLSKTENGYAYIYIYIYIGGTEFRSRPRERGVSLSG